jgi:hypothetical protein
MVFAELVESCLVDPQALKIWRDLMAPVNYFFKNPVAEKFRDEGRDEGRVEKGVTMTLNILEWRGIRVSDSVRRRVETCSDEDLLEIWARRAMHVTDAQDLFDDDRA